MKCPKCGYHSFEYLDACKKCNADLAGFKDAHKITPVILPRSEVHTDLGSSAPAARMAEATGTQDDFLTDNPAIIATAGVAAGAADVNSFGEFSFDDEPLPATGNEPAAWDTSENAAAIFGEAKVGHELPDLFGDQAPKS